MERYPIWLYKQLLDYGRMGFVKKNIVLELLRKLMVGLVFIESIIMKNIKDNSKFKIFTLNGTFK